MKYLIAGLGNIGPDYEFTRHNIGFMVLDALAKASNAVFEDKRYGFVAEMRLKNRQLDRKSTRLNSSHVRISYAVFCLKKKKKKKKKKQYKNKERKKTNHSIGTKEQKVHQGMKNKHANGKVVHNKYVAR